METVKPHKAPSFNPINAISRKANIIISLFFWVYSICCLLPIILVLSVSFSEEKSVLTDGYRFIPLHFSLEAYRFMFLDINQIVKSYGISVLVTVAGTAISVIIMSLFAYPISRNDFPHKRIFTFFMFFTMLFNGGLVPWYLVYTQFLDLKNSIWALIIPLLISPFFVLVIRTFFQTTIPPALIESARIDGAGETTIFSRIVMPLSLPVLATVALFSTLNYWNDWFLSLVFITDNTTISIQYLMYKAMLNIQFMTTNIQAQQGFTQAGGSMNLPTESVRMAMCVIGVGPIVFAYPFFQRFFIKGLTVGSVKG
ncbi:ABC transporter permease subunit [Paenibacillus sp. LMG 31461]|uniref:ABC transporter permease subunit n=1 Tax=Paenibacillus plantarum TaxID=2654975 RepID=A0ABX1XF77_9BACL|nr:ABC transporter permease subunit [Paenibacillus plantarum]